MVAARDVPMGSQLLTCAEPPSLVRMLVLHLVADHDGCGRRVCLCFSQACIHSVPSGSNVQLLLAPQFEKDSATIDCTVHNRTTRLNEAHVMILPIVSPSSSVRVQLQQFPCTAPSAIMLAVMSVMNQTW